LSTVAGLIYIVDDDASVRKSLGRLARSAGYDAEPFASAEEFLSSELAPAPCCLVLDVRLPGLDGLELQERLAEKETPVPVIFISGHGDIPMSVKAMRRGAIDFLPKPFSDDNLLGAIENALARSVQLREARSRKRRIHALVETLTPREQEIMRWVITGMLNRQIAGELGIAEKTVKVHRGRVMQKMQAGSVAELVRLAEEAGIRPPGA
jgi:RNA polymerase sigma factor (sigma-70 family)